jgi:hypothetical protein
LDDLKAKFGKPICDTRVSISTYWACRRRRSIPRWGCPAGQ